MKKTLLALCLSLCLTAASAAPDSAKEEALYSPKRFGLYLSGFGDGPLALVSINAAYDPGDWRFTAGVGNLFGLSLGAGIRYSVVNIAPDLRLLAGVNFSTVVNEFGAAIGSWIAGGLGGNASSKPETIFYFGPSLGFDWKTESGFMMGLGANLWIHQSTYNVLPFLNIGWFF